MSIRRFFTDERMSQIVVHGDTVYLSGQVDFEQTADTAAAQMERILSRVDHLLALAGSSRSSLLTATIWLADLEDFAAVNAVWSAWLPGGSAPARATIAAGLAFPRLRVELAVTAAKDCDL